MIKLYGHEVSGNSYKVRLLLSLLKLDYEWIRVDLMKGEHKTPEYLAKNPFGQVPLLIDDETTIADAQAILVYLARKYGGEQWLPTEALPMAQVIRWLSTAAGEVRQGLENARLFYLFGAGTKINIDRATEKSHFILKQLDQHLSTRNWLEGDRPTIADIAIYPYISLAHDGKIEMDAYTHVLNWIERVKQLSGYVPMAGV
ncbi:glutathione S-transferase family protein [Pseudanabaena sp. Chao 1811]|uniref:glutathione S-transferase family protein n=1 Tax=Pseudanabaena sp. Chao 1811 TaxID=2963092 RepID=UPI0022F3DD47|nr:glutathione S-transferase [Pseudanabaena sp. Chao 1811]